MNEPATIFISYRRDDSDGYARFLHRLLLEWFDEETVYFDRRTPSLGSDFMPEILHAIEQQSAVVLVLIGRWWLGHLIERSKRGESDLVRLELETALGRRASGQLVIIPVLAGIDIFPEPRDAPPEIARLLLQLRSLNAAVDLFHGSVDDASSRFERFVHQTLASIPGVPRPAIHMPRAYEAPFSLGASLPIERYDDPHGVLQALEQRLSAGAQVDHVLRCTVSGMAGVGKSELARQFAAKWRASFAGGVCWLPGHDAAVFRSAVEAACRACLIPLRHDDDVGIVWRSWLERTRLPWLIVIDDHEPAAVPADVLPRIGPHRVLFTTRDLGSPKALRLAPWSEEAARTYLREQLEDLDFPPDDVQLARLAAALGGVPLAIAHAVAYLQETSSPVGPYLAMLEDLEKAPALLDSKLRAAPEKAVLPTLRSALQHCSPVAQRLLQTLACFSREPVPERWLRAAVAGRDEGDAAVLNDDLRWNELVGGLRGLALVSRVATFEAGLNLAQTGEAPREQPCLQLNRLTQQALLVTVPTDSPARDVATHILAGAAEREMAIAGRTVEYACLLPHLLFRATMDENIDAARLLRLAAQLHRAKGDFASACEYSRHWLARSEELLGREAPESAEAALLLAEDIAEIGRPADALQWAQSAAQAIAALPQAVPELLARARSLQARCLVALGHLDDGLAVYDRELLDAYVLADESVPIRPWLVHALRDMSEASNARGRHDRALDLQQQVLELAEGVFGPWHAATLRCAVTLSATLLQLGQAQNAARISDLVVQRGLDQLGLHHPTTIAGLLGLAQALHRLQRDDDARSVHEMAWSAANLTLLDNDPQLTALRQLGEQLDGSSDTSRRTT